MISFDDYARLDGPAMAEQVRRGALGPAALLDATIARIEATRPAPVTPIRRSRAHASRPR